MATARAKATFGEGSAMTIGANGFPVISYVDRTNDALKVAVCRNRRCDQSTVSTVPNVVAPTHGTDIALGLDGFPVVVGSVAGGGASTVVYCADPACATAPRLSPLLSGSRPVVLIGVDGVPISAFVYFFTLGVTRGAPV